jgi:F0F1-type ATP synthase membrane subunit b/b'
MIIAHQSNVLLESSRAQFIELRAQISKLIAQATSASDTSAESARSAVETCVRTKDRIHAAIMNKLATECLTAAAALLDEGTVITEKHDKWELYTLQHGLYTVGKVSALHV